MIRFFIVLVIVATSFVLVPIQVHAKAVPGEYLVTIKSPERPFAFSSDAPMFRGARFVKQLRYRSNLFLVRADAGKEGEVERLLRNDVRVAKVQPNFEYRAFFAPNDPSYALQWNYEAIHVPAAWDFDGTAPLYGGDASVVVAVLDTGAAYENYQSYVQAPDLAGTNFVQGTDIVNDDSHPNDDHGHGTHVTSTIAETTNNGISTAGIAFNSSIMPVKVLDGDGLGTTADIASGIDFARTNGADIINMSLGGSTDDPVLHAAVQQATQAGIIVVAATGNDGATSLAYPAAYEETIAVGATRYDETVAHYSNTGSGLDLVAPGGDLDVDQNSDGQPDGILQQTCTSNACTSFDDFFYEGTSQATPHVSATAALLLAAGVSASNVRGVLEGSAKDLGTSGYDTTFGWGLLDAVNALSVATNDTAPPTGSISIAGGAQFTNSIVAVLTLHASDPESQVTSMAFSNDGATFSPWELYAEARSGWDLSLFGGASSQGTKVVTVKFRDAAGNVSDPVSASIRYDSLPPSSPVIHVAPPLPWNRVELTSGGATSVKSFVATWDESVDEMSGLVGYRVAISSSEDANLSGEPVTTDRTFASSTQTSGRKLYLHVGAVDGAGNMSVSTFTYVYQQLRIVTGTLSNGGSVSILKSDAKLLKQLTPFGKKYKNGIQVAAVPLHSGEEELLIVAPASSRGDVEVLNNAGKLLLKLQPYGATGPRGMNVAGADLDSDGEGEILVAPREGAFPVVVYSSKGKVEQRFYPFGKTYRGGISLAVGDLIGNGTNRVIAAQVSAKPLVRVLNARGQRTREFLGFPSRGRFGLSIAAGDINGDGKAEIVVAPSEGSSQVRVFSPAGKLLRQFFAFKKSFQGGLRLATGDRDGDGKSELFIGPARGGAQVKIFNEQAKQLMSAFSMPKTFRGGISIATLR